MIRIVTIGKNQERNKAVAGNLAVDATGILAAVVARPSINENNISLPFILLSYNKMKVINVSFVSWIFWIFWIFS
jgi:hypothetical protein